MAGSKVLGSVAVLLAAAALLVSTATAVDDEHIYHWKCFTSCNTRCHDEDNAAAAAEVHGASSASVSAVGGGGASHRCKKGCLNECFEDIPALCYQQCVVKTCLCKPPYSKEKIECMKMCCDKCFHHGPAPPMPPKPSPPKPNPPGPKPNPPPGPKPSPPKPKSPPPPPKPKPPCPPGGKNVVGRIEN